MTERITVVKIGGNVIDDAAALKRFLGEFAALPGAKILVHGGGSWPRGWPSGWSWRCGWSKDAASPTRECSTW